MRVSVIIPAYRRPVDLRRCLNALLDQTVQPFEVVVSVREFDRSCREVIRGFESRSEKVRMNIVTKPGQIYAWKSAYEKTTGNIVSFLDDDSEPAEDWIEQIMNHFTNSDCAGVGGYTPNTDETGEEMFIKSKPSRIGKLYWYGRFLGNFHEYYPKVLKVDSLRGANMSFRREYIANNFHFKLKGREYKNDTALSFEAVKRGGYLEYNPEIKVLHHVGEQFLNKGRWPSNREQYANSYNTTILMLRYKNIFKFFMYLVFSIMIGQDDAPGILRMIKGVWDGWFMYAGFFVFAVLAKLQCIFDYAFGDIGRLRDG